MNAPATLPDKPTSVRISRSVSDPDDPVGALKKGYQVIFLDTNGAVISKQEEDDKALTLEFVDLPAAVKSVVIEFRAVDPAGAEALAYAQVKIP